MVGTDLGLGSVLDGRYRLVRDIAAGAMGRLVEAEHLVLGKAVAIKFVLSQPDARIRRRMVQEARAAQQLASEHIVRVFDVGIVGGAPYIVMELLEGTDLGQLVEGNGPLPVADAVDYVLQACVGLAEAHAVGVVHRDIKPSNLFLTRSALGMPLVKVLDFGISKLGEGVETADGSAERTAESALLGSPYYMSPEQLRNPTRVDARSDVWSLAVTLFHLLSRAHPFEGETLNEVSAAIFTDPPKGLELLRDDVPSELEAAIEQALAKRPEERTQSMADFAASIAPFASKRGRLSAERVSAAPPSVTPRQLTISSPGVSREAELASTLPALSSDAPPRSADARTASSGAPAPTRRWLLFGLAVVAVLALGIGVWMRPRDEPAPVATSPEPSPPAPAAAAPATAATVPAPAPKTVRVEPAADAAAPAKPEPRSPAPVRRAATAAPKPSAKPPSPRPALDIDGVPIVE